MGRTGLAALGGLVLALATGTQLVSQLYFRLATRSLDDGRPQLALRAASLSAQLAPWDADPLALEGWVAASLDRPDDSLRAYARALRQAPGDARLWTEYSQARTRLGLFDEDTAAAATSALRRGPESPPILRALAEQGVAYWERGDDALKGVWLQALRIRLERARPEVLAAVVTRGRVDAFCAGPAAPAGEMAWCAGAPALRGCFDIGPKGPVPCHR